MTSVHSPLPAVAALVRAGCACAFCAAGSPKAAYSTAVLIMLLSLPAASATRTCKSHVLVAVPLGEGGRGILARIVLPEPLLAAVPRTTPGSGMSPHKAMNQT